MDCHFCFHESLTTNKTGKLDSERFERRSHQQKWTTSIVIKADEFWQVPHKLAKIAFKSNSSFQCSSSINRNNIMNLTPSI
jgi:hypothetical protein